MTDRITLALAACEGLTNDELAERGPGAFKKMIERKRMYAQAARSNALAVGILKAGLQTCKIVVAKLQEEIAKAHVTIQELESYDGQITDVSQAQELLKGIMQKEQ